MMLMFLNVHFNLILCILEHTLCLHCTSGDFLPSYSLRWTTWH
uniref:Uncharacterized protein n=1 Tax=Rhizophora mucronata TaxID=61149 RepID=A0A2P2PPU7_RHIMU